MPEIVYFLSFAVFCLTWREISSHCYSEICQNRTTDLKKTGPQCLLTSVQRGKDCVNLSFENLGHTQPPSHQALGKFQLSAYVKDFGEFRGKATAFNLSISEITFTRLITRYQDSSADRQAACREIEIYGNTEGSVFPEIFVSCPFADETFEGSPYRLEYLAVGSTFEYSRKLVFVVPKHAAIESTNDVTAYTPFFYVDVSKTNVLSLHIQRLPEHFNVSLYRVWLINNETNNAITLDLKSEGEAQIEHTFSVMEGVHYFKVAAVHPSCGEYGCVNGTSPTISTKIPPRRLLIMIISIVWIPPVVLYVVYHFYKLYMKTMLEKCQQRRINCLLVYSPTHPAHVEVMRKFALYLRSCHINAMIDILDIPKTANKDPGLWCNSAFQKADVIIVATSPRAIDAEVPSIYRNIDNHAIRLLKENYSRGNKRYFGVQFPYCEKDELPEEARLFRRFSMPKELEKLVRNVYAVNRIRLFGVSNSEFLEAVKFATVNVSVRPKIAKETEGHGEIGPTKTKKTQPNGYSSTEICRRLMKSDLDTSNETKKTIDQTEKKYFTTNIAELNLLGDNGEAETFIHSPPTSDNEFSIDRLNL